jgi:MFS family permease
MPTLQAPLAAESIPLSASRAPGRRRWLLPLALSVSTLVGFVDRLNLAIALPLLATEYGWNAQQVGARGGALLSSFFVGYGLSNIFLTPLAARLGPRRSLLLVVVLFSLFTSLGAPLAGSLGLLVASRFCLGLGEGPHFPMMSTLVKSWFPEHERSRANGLWIGGAVLATVVAPLVIVPLVNRYGVRVMLLLVGSLGLLLTLPLLRAVVFDTPRAAPWMARAELEWLAEERAGEVEREPGSSYAFLRLRAFWVAVLAGSLNNFVAFGVLSWLPTYFTKGRQLPFEDLGYAASLPYVFGIFGVALAAWLGDRLGKRALLAGAGFLLASLFIYFAARAASIPATIACFAAAVLFQSAYTPQEFALLQRILPARSISRGSGVYNGLAILLGGGLGSWGVGAVVAATHSYTAGIFTLMVVAVGAAVTLFGLARLVKC